MSLAFLIGWAAWVSLPRLRPATVTYFALVCVSIVFTAQHHVVDLLTGAALGAAVLVAVARLEARAPPSSM